LAKKTGLLVTLEGSDGAGKTTQALLLAAALKRAGRKVCLTKEPGGSPLSARIRALLLDPDMRGLQAGAELLLFAADRRQHVSDTIAPALRRGDIVLCDRFTDSTLAYQGAGRAVAGPEVAWITRFAAQGLVPDLTLFFDLPVAEGLLRARKRKGSLDRMEGMEPATLERVRRAFLGLHRREPGRMKRIQVLGRRPEEICAEAMGLLAPLLGKR
jgi:dTMP kinase